MVLINGTNVKFLVNTVNSQEYNTKALPRLVSSLRSQVNSDDIVVVMGNSDTEGVSTETDYTLVRVKHNSMDMTALIGVLDNQSNLGTLPDSWFYLHDTCEVGSNFLSNLQSKDLSSDVRVHWSVSNLGVYTNNSLLANSELIQSYKSSDNPEWQERRESKHRAVCDNNIIYRVNNNTSNLSSDVPEEMSQSRVYGVIRKRLYFSELDLYKNWSNFVWGRRQDPPRFNMNV